MRRSFLERRQSQTPCCKCPPESEAAQVPSMRQRLLGRRTPKLACCNCAQRKRPHKCPQCDKGFSREGHLNWHVASVHDKKTPHKCPKGFSRKGDLNSHVASVHEMKGPHTCPQCDEGFSRKGDRNFSQRSSRHDRQQTTQLKCSPCDKVARQTTHWK